MNGMPGPSSNCACSCCIRPPGWVSRSDWSTRPTPVKRVAGVDIVNGLIASRNIKMGAYLAEKVEPMEIEEKPPEGVPPDEAHMEKLTEKPKRRTRRRMLIFIAVSLFN